MLDGHGGTHRRRSLSGTNLVQPRYLGMASNFTILREALLDTVRQMARATTSASVWFFDTVIARAATEDDLPKPVYLVARRRNIRRTSR